MTAQPRQASSGKIVMQDNCGGGTTVITQRRQSDPVPRGSQIKHNNGNDSTRSTYMTLTSGQDVNHFSEEVIEAITRRVTDSLR